MQGIVDEIIVIDTGSTDKTVEIAKKYTDKVYFFEWTNNFAEARNESLRYAQGKYVLVIDADEYFDDYTKQQLRPFLESHEIAGGFLTVYNYTGEFTRKIDYTPVLLLRILRRGFYYSEAIHEQVDQRIFKDQYPVKSIPVILHHVGYMNQIVEAKNKRKRNQNILEDLLKERPDDLFHRLNLAAEFLRYGEFEETLKLVKENHREFDIINKIQAHTEDRDNVHLVARNYKFYIVSLVNLKRYDEAIAIADEALSILPKATDFIYIKGIAQKEKGDLLKANLAFQKCLEIGDMSVSLYDIIVGAGNYLAHLNLGDLWARNGDDQLALKHFTTSFFEQPMVSPNVVFYLMHFMPKDKKVLYDYFESKMTDIETYHNYAEAYVVYHMPDPIEVIERAEKRYGRSPITERARCALLLQNNESSFLSYAIEQGQSFHYYWVGIFYLENDDFEHAEYYLTQGGSRGIELWKKLNPILIQEGQSGPDISVYLRDLVAINAVKLFHKWIPIAPDMSESWVYLKYSPFQKYLENIEWKGENVYQCELKTLKYFHLKNMEYAYHWLHKSFDFQTTVTKVLIEADLALANERLQDAVTILSFGRLIFPDSMAIKNSLLKLFGSTDALLILQSIRKTHKLEDLLMNPLDAYRKNVIDTMPLNIQLAQLHMRGAALAKQAKLDTEAGNIMEVRARIQELQEILTFLRSSLDPALEISVQTDEIYLFYYKMLVKWFLNPKEIPEEFDVFVEFWESWAKTWAKAQVK